MLFVILLPTVFLRSKGGSLKTSWSSYNQEMCYMKCEFVEWVFIDKQERIMTRIEFKNPKCQDNLVYLMKAAIFY